MDKNSWHSRTRAQMGRIAKRLGILSHARVIRSNKGGPAVGGEVTMSAPEFGIYVHLSCPVNAYGQQDWIGCSYARKATVQDPYGTSMESRNHTILGTDDDSIVRMVESIKNGFQRTCNRCGHAMPNKPHWVCPCHEVRRIGQ